MAYRVGIVGVGWGSIVHAPAFRLVDGFEVAALCARSERSLTKASAQLDIADVSQDWETFVRRDDLDVISIATPVALHHPIALAALDAGKHVLVEKPLALTTQQCEEMIDAAQHAGRATATCFELRWLPERSKVRQLVREGVVGDPYFVRLSQRAAYWHPTHANQALWMYDRAQGGGYLSGMVSHDIDFVCSLFGTPVQVCAEVRTSVPQRPLPDGSTLEVTADDTVVLLLRLDSGALAVLSASVVGVHTSGADFEAFGRNGTITGGLSRRPDLPMLAGTADATGLSPAGVDDREPASGRAVPARGAAGPIRAMALMLEDWLPALDGAAPRQPIPTLRDGLVVQRVIDAAYASAEGGGWVDL